ncbi:hypothetical protein [Psychromonas sp.]|uniref:glutamine amidotransferase-related protein n=1 Tax=Psychromonas sp. TaxID=1884585 RepID=UPI00356804F8
MIIASVLDEFTWISELILFVQQAFASGKKLFGVCFGHQLIIQALGGIVERSTNGWGLDVYSTNLYKNYGGLEKGQSLSLLSMHQDQVLTVQGHPEFSASFFLALLGERKSKFNDFDIENAIKYSEKVIDNKRLNRIINQLIFGIYRTHDD